MEGIELYGKLYQGTADKSQNFIMKFNSFPTKISASLELSRADVQKSDLGTRALISKAGMDAHQCCTTLIKDANNVAEELLELKDIANAASRVLKS